MKRLLLLVSIGILLGVVLSALPSRWTCERMRALIPVQTDRCE